MCLFSKPINVPTWYAVPICTLLDQLLSRKVINSVDRISIGILDTISFINCISKTDIESIHIFMNNHLTNMENSPSNLFPRIYSNEHKNLNKDSKLSIRNKHFICL